MTRRGNSRRSSSAEKFHVFNKHSQKSSHYESSRTYPSHSPNNSYDDSPRHRRYGSPNRHGNFTVSAHHGITSHKRENRYSQLEHSSAGTQSSGEEFGDTDDKRSTTECLQTDSQRDASRRDVHHSFSSWLSKATSREHVHSAERSFARDYPSVSSHLGVSMVHARTDIAFEAPNEGCSSVPCLIQPGNQVLRAVSSEYKSMDISPKEEKSKKRSTEDIGIDHIQNSSGRYSPIRKMSESATAPKLHNTMNGHESSQGTGNEELLVRKGERNSDDEMQGAQVLPRKWMLRKMTLYDWQLFRNAIFAHGDEVSKLAFKMMQELLLSPSNGVSENQLPAICGLLENMPHLTFDRESEFFIPLSQFPEHLQKLISDPLSDLFGKRALKSPLTSPCQDRNPQMSPVSSNGNTDDLSTGSPPNESGCVADRILFDNIRYFFDHIKNRNAHSGEDTSGKSAFVWRGRPDHNSEGMVTCSKERKDDLVCLDPLYTKIMSDLYEDYVSPRIRLV